MSVLIKDMKMPKNCSECEFHWQEDIYYDIMHHCQITCEYINSSDIHRFPYDCPLLELPDNHGDLIDRQALLREMIYIGDRPVSTGLRYIREAPTIVEAEGEG